LDYRGIAYDVLKRIFYSLAGGFILPISYFLGLSFFDDYFPVSSRYVLGLPIAWPRPIYFHAFAVPKFSIYDTFDPYLTAFIILCNLAAYTLLVYLLLSAIAVIRRQ